MTVYAPQCKDCEVETACRRRPHFGEAESLLASQMSAHVLQKYWGQISSFIPGRLFNQSDAATGPGSLIEVRIRRGEGRS